MRRSYNIPFMMGMAYITLSLLSLVISMSQRLINALSLGAVLLSISELLNVCNMQKVKKRSITNVLKREDCKDKYAIAFIYIQEILNEKNSVLNRRKSIFSFLGILCNSFAFMCLLVLPHTDILALFDSSNKFGVFCTVISLGIIFISISIDNGREQDSEMRDMQELIDCFIHITDEADEQVEKAVKLAETAIEMNKENMPHAKNAEKQEQ